MLIRESMTYRQPKILSIPLLESSTQTIHTIPIVENSRLDSYIVSLSNILEYESNNCAVSVNSILEELQEINQLDKPIVLAINEADLIQDPSLIEEYSDYPIIVEPINEHCNAAVLGNYALNNFFETGSTSLLECYINHKFNEYSILMEVEQANQEEKIKAAEEKITKLKEKLDKATSPQMQQSLQNMINNATESLNSLKGIKKAPISREEQSKDLADKINDVNQRIANETDPEKKKHLEKSKAFLEQEKAQVDQGLNISAEDLAKAKEEAERQAKEAEERAKQEREELEARKKAAQNDSNDNTTTPSNQEEVKKAAEEEANKQPEQQEQQAEQPKPAETQNTANKIEEIKNKAAQSKNPGFISQQIANLRKWAATIKQKMEEAQKSGKSPGIWMRIKNLIASAINFLFGKLEAAKKDQESSSTPTTN